MGGDDRRSQDRFEAWVRDHPARWGSAAGSFLFIFGLGIYGDGNLGRLAAGAVLFGVVNWFVWRYVVARTGK
jgi:hypothetical protein